ncbi:MAG: VCBS repeat-containing protein [Planctomycetota bacterium]
MQPRGLWPLIALILGLLATPSDAHAQLAFTSTDYPVGGAPAALATGDFNGDGALDLAVTIADGAAVQILLGNAGAFVAGNTVPVGTNPVDIVTADFNNDGHLDFATADNDAPSSLVGFATVSIRLGDGLGAFSAAPFIDAFICRAIASGDFNGDGNADLAIHRGAGHPGANSFVWMYLGDGLGGFTANGQYTVGINVWDLHATHVNNDSFLDLVVTCNGVQPQLDSGVFTVIGDGTGSFTAFPTNPLMAPYMASALGDFDGNGSVDLVAHRVGGSGCQDSIDVVSGDGAGGFAIATTLTLPCGDHTFATADWNGDGESDIAVARQANPLSPTLVGSVTMALSDTIGGYTLQDVAVAQAPRALLSEDLDGNGMPDLVVAHGGATNITVLLNGGVTTASVFLRGDSNSNGSIGIDDAITTLQYLFVAGTPVPTCLDAADFDDNGSVVLNDPIAVLAYLFNNGATPPLPFPICGFDVTPSSLAACNYPQASCP